MDARKSRGLGGGILSFVQKGLFFLVQKPVYLLSKLE
jgi:hypothetical protein